MDTKAAIEKLNETLINALNTRKINECLPIFDNDARILPPNTPEITGISAISRFFELWVELSGGIFDHQLLEFGVQENLAYQIASYQIKSGQKSDKGKMVQLLRRKKDGSWKVFLTMLNSDLPPQVK